METAPNRREEMNQRTFRRHFGKRIAEARRRRGWNQEQLADRLRVTRARLGKWEGGYTSPPAEELVALSEALDVSVDHLLAGRRSMRPPTGLDEEAKELLTEYLAGILDLLK
jgi:transcriptional regulator with XRE-family HTH domain